MKTTQTTTALTYFEQRGTLTYMKYNYTYVTLDGWFYLDHGTVIMRKIGGRNSFRRCEEVQVYDFKLHEKKVK